jgi:hypothetical protein
MKEAKMGWNGAQTRRRAAASRRVALLLGSLIGAASLVVSASA